MRARCSSAPSTARSSSSDSAFTCASSLRDARLIVTLSAAPRSAVSARNAPTPMSLTVAVAARSTVRSQRSRSRRLVFATSSGTRDAARSAAWIRSVRARFSSSVAFGSFIAALTCAYAALSSSTSRMKSFRRLSASAMSAVVSSLFSLRSAIRPTIAASAASVVKRRADLLKGVVDAVNLTDSNRANVAMAAIPAAVLVRDAGVEPIVQVTGRDRNRIALQADLLGAAALGLPNFLFMTGDDPKKGNHPEAVHVKDLDGIELVRTAASLRDGRLLNGDEVKQPPRYLIGATASPADAKDVDRTLEKIAAGAQFIQTQPVFDPAPFSQWLAEIRKRAKDVAILAGVLVLRSAEQVDRLAKVPGIVLPAAIRKRIRDAADGEAEGVAIAIETVRSLRALPGVNGVHLYAIEWPEAIPIVVRGAGLLPRPTAKEVATA